MIDLPAPCGRHVLNYPSALVGEAMLGRDYAFVTSCDCEDAYLVHLEADGAHYRLVGSAEGVAATYDAIPGSELVIEDSNGMFVVKRLDGW